ncbi:uncharacterized protein LOC128709987 [Anopheles marshallii]|uniref:uncharacterized protein LOC128709987 n=1 Tax=Anopheles marshallii TaxID=1521116 RepID=UPI00237B14E4|nr:uncharacterized protein LOC128709987 [Anopheles marshallii]
MSILLQETGGGNSGSTVTAATTPNEDGNIGSSLTVDSVPMAKETCTGDCHYGRSWKEYVELLAQMRVVDVDDGEMEKQQQDETCPESDCVCTAQPVSSECHKGDVGNQQKPQHSENVFPLDCCCRMCNASREVVMKLYAEDCQYNSLWDRLQLLMKQYYDLIPESEDNALFNQYMELMSKSSLKWLTDVRFSRNNIIQISLASNLPLSNEMAFVMLTNVLSTRDPHQLFELLCFQLRSIVQVYCVGLEDLVTENPEDGSRQFNATEVLNYIVNGYKKLRQSARTVTPLLNVLEQCHLGKFGLTWWLINQRIFQRYFYYEVQSIVPDCMKQMRGTLPEREYQELVARFLKFDKEMADIALTWVDVWPLLYEYHRSPDDCERRHRMKTVHALLQSIRGARYMPKSPELFEKPERPIAEWMELKNRKLAWEYVVHCLKTKWIPGVNTRLNNVADVVKCPGCDRPLNTHNMVCACLSCIIGGGIFPYRPKKEVNERYGMCTCANMIEMLLESQGKTVPACDDDHAVANVHQLLSSSLLLTDGEVGMQNGCVNSASRRQSDDPKLDDQKDNLEQDAAAYLPLMQSLSEDDELYHIAWAIFNHLPERVPYRWNTLEPSRFCTFQASPCSSIACRVAINIIAMNYPIHLSRLLIHSYKPVSEEPRRIMKGNWNTKARNSLRKLCSKRWQEEMDDQMHPLRFVDMFWSLQNSTLNLPKTRASDLAEWFMLDTQAPPRNVFYQYFTKFFLVKDDDIVFDVECYERERERSVSPNRMRESLMQKLETHSAATLTTSASSGSSSSSSSCLSSSTSSSSSSSCSFSTASAASVAAAAAAAAAAASTFIEPMVTSTGANGNTNEGRGCTCICNSCVTEFLSQSEMMSKQFDPLARDSLTQRTNMLEMELKALLKERNMLLEKGGGVNACKLLKRDDSCTPKDAHEASKVDLNVESEATKTSIPTSDMGTSVTEATDATNGTEQHQIDNLKEVNVISSSSEKECSVAATNALVTQQPKASATVTAISPSKALLNENNPTDTSSASICSQPRPDTAQATAAKSNSELQTPAKLSAFAKLAASKLPALVSSTTAGKSTPKQEGTTASANGASVKPKSPSASQPQTGNGNRTVTIPIPAASATQTHSTSKPCPCGMPSHAPGAKAGTGSKTRPVAGATAQGSTASASTAHSKEDHKKSCHRGTAPASASGGDKTEGSCVCYYCTLFGQSVCLECNHNQRTNETRDKLRKKLQNKQEQKTTSNNSTTAAKGLNVVAVKKVTSNNATAPVGSAGKASVPHNTALSANSNSKTVADKGNKKGDKSATTPSTAGKGNRFQSIDDLLRFIEGDDTFKGASNTPAKGKSSRIQSTEKSEQKQSSNSATTQPTKKSTTAASPAVGKDSDTIKKAKLNESLKLIAELEVLRQRFYDCQKHEQKALQHLQDQSGLSKKERKELPLKIQTYRQQKNELHATINRLVTSIRSEIPEYPFKLEAFATPPSCCTAPQQKPGQQTINAPRDVQVGGRKMTPGAMLPPPPSTLTAAGKAHNNVHAARLAKLHESINNYKQKRQQQLGELQQQQDQMIHDHLQQFKQQPQQPVGYNDATSQQLVTIKRTFLPHPQPQITVTAKGDSPDQDQILYTFVNGKMVLSKEPLNADDLDNFYDKPGELWAKTKNGPVAIDEAKVQNMNRFNPERQDPHAHLPPFKDSCITPVFSKENLHQQQRQQHTLSIDDLIREQELINNLQTNCKGDPEMLSLVQNLKKDLLEMQKNPPQPSGKTSGVANKGNIKAPLNKQPIKRETATKPIPTSGDQQGSKGKASSSASIPAVELSKVKNKKDHKKDKLIEEIDEIVARLNLLDSDEEDAKPTSKRKQKSSSTSQTKVLNRKQSKDSIVSSGSGNAPTGSKQQPKSQSKQQQTMPASGAQTKSSQSQELQKKKKDTSAVAQKPIKDDKPVVGENVISKDKVKAQSQQPAFAVETTATPVETCANAIVRKKVPKTFIDPEFDNNAFRLLNMDDSESEIEEEEEIPTVESVSPLQEEKTAQSSVHQQPNSNLSVKDSKKKSKESILEVSSNVATEPQGQQDKPNRSFSAAVSKGGTEKEKKSSQKKAAKPEMEPKPTAPGGSGPGKQKRDEVEGSAKSAGTPIGDGAEQRPKKQTPAQAMVEKISALLDSPGLSNRQRKQMIRQLEQAQATIQTQLLQNAAKATKAKVQAQAQQEKMANQMATNIGNNASKSCAGKEASSNKARQANARIAPACNDSEYSSSTSGARNSLMEQLKRGIRAEGLDLPPGITLTRLDAIQAEALRLKRESIRKLSVPLKPVTPPLDTSAAMLPGAFGATGSPNAGMFVVNPMSPISMPGQQDSVIMVNTGKLRGQEQQQQTCLENGTDRKKRNKRRKNKGKDQEQNERVPSSIGTSINSGTEVSAANHLVDGSNIVTLRNPMFHSGPMGMGGVGMHPPGAPMMSDVQGARMTLGYDQPAKIFKNDNGMFTIRNPALHHAVSGGAPPEVTGFRPFNAAYLVENGIMPPSGNMQQPMGTVPHVTAAVSSGPSTMMPGNGSIPAYLQQYPPPALDDSMGPRKCKSVIGSEMKNAQKQKQNSLQQQGAIGGGLPSAPGRSWQHMNGTTGQDIFIAPSSSPSTTNVGGLGESHYSSFNHYNLSGQDMLHGAPAGTPGRYGGSGMLGPPGYYHGSVNGAPGLSKAATSNVSAIGSERSHGLSYLGGADPSGSLATHCCDDEVPSAFFNGNSLGSLPSGSMSSRTRYDDLAFLQNLQPGQRLNSEVTIHSINESKMRRQQAQNYTHDIQITPIPAPSPPTGGRAGGLGVPVASSTVSLQHLMQQSHQAHLQQQQQQHPDTQLHLSDLSPGSGSVGSGSGSGSRTGVTLTDFMDSRVSGGSSSSTSADLLAPSLELDAKNFLRDYQLGQLQQQMQDLQLQPGEFGDNVFANKQPKANIGEQESDEQDLESLERLNYLLAASGGTSSNSMKVPSAANSSTTETVCTTAVNDVEEGNPGGVSIGGEELQRPQQPPIGTPSSKNLQQHRLQQNGTPVSTAGGILYPATADSPASSVSVFDGISSSLSSQAHSFDDLYTGLLATASPPTSISGSNESTGCNTNLNSQLNIHQLPHQVSTDTGYVPSNVNGLPEASVAAKSVDNADSPTSLSNK